LLSDRPVTLDLLESVLSGQPMTAADLDQLLTDKTAEDLYLDYKHGNEVAKGREGRETIRRYASGFANSAGGILIMGVDEGAWSVTGCEAPGGDLSAWASRCLTPIAGYFAPPPVLQTVEHPHGQVLVAAAARSAVLVPCIERDKKPTYYLRLHDQTLPAEEYLVADLVLGRRRHPYLALGQVETIRYELPHDELGNYDCAATLRFEVENQGFAFAEDVTLGVVGLHSHLSGSTSPPGAHLLQHIRTQQPNDDKYAGQSHTGVHVVCQNRLAPFATTALDTPGPVSIPIAWHSTFYTPYRWRAAVYLVARGAPPAWHQLTIDVCPDLLQLLRSRREPISTQGRFMHIDRLATARPVVSWEGPNI
jgi:hypothetical protein